MQGFVAFLKLSDCLRLAQKLQNYVGGTLSEVVAKVVLSKSQLVLEDTKKGFLGPDSVRVFLECYYVMFYVLSDFLLLAPVQMNAGRIVENFVTDGPTQRVLGHTSRLDGRRPRHDWPS